MHPRSRRRRRIAVASAPDFSSAATAEGQQAGAFPAVTFPAALLFGFRDVRADVLTEVGGGESRGRSCNERQWRPGFSRRRRTRFCLHRANLARSHATRCSVPRQLNMCRPRYFYSASRSRRRCVKYPSLSYQRGKAKAVIGERERERKRQKAKLSTGEASNRVKTRSR